jgi:MerR family redox-sensitive transcriptional activator SoxR
MGGAAGRVEQLPRILEADGVADVYDVNEVSGYRSLRALHFYEAKGLIRSFRTNGNQRRYALEVRRVAIIRVAQRIGMTLEPIRKALKALPANERQTEDLSASWKNELSERIERLTRLRDNSMGASVADVCRWGLARCEIRGIDCQRKGRTEIA